MLSGFVGGTLTLVLLVSCCLHGSQGSTHAYLLRHRHLEDAGQRPRLPEGYIPPAALCIKDTGRHCTVATNSGAVVDVMSQCHSHMATNFSAPSPRVSRMSASAECDPEAHRCMCKAGFCADADTGCYEGTYDMLSTPFRITTKDFGLDKPLYMSRDGKVKMGEPPSEAAATWHVSISQSGVKHLVTGAFRDVVLEEQDVCTEAIDGSGYPSRQCLTIVGHSNSPRADSTGWRFETHSEFVDERSGDHGIYLQIKNVHTGSYLFMNPPPSDEAHMCVSGAAHCPGEYGALRFDPPFPMDMIDVSVYTTDGAITYFYSYGLVALVMLCLYKAYSNLESKTSRFDDDVAWVLIIPLRNCAECVGLRNVFHTV